MGCTDLLWLVAHNCRFFQRLVFILHKNSPLINEKIPWVCRCGWKWFNAPPSLSDKMAGKRTMTVFQWKLVNFDYFDNGAWGQLKNDRRTIESHQIWTAIFNAVFAGYEIHNDEMTKHPYGIKAIWALINYANNSSRAGDAHICQWTESSLLQVMACSRVQRV